MAQSTEKLPQSLELEQGILGAALVNNDVVEILDEINISPEMFFDDIHGRIYEVIKLLIDRGETASPLSLKSFFEGNPALDDVGGAKYLVRLAASAATIIGAKDYGLQLRDLFDRRCIIIAANDLETAAANDFDTKTNEIISSFEDLLDERQSKILGERANLVFTAEQAAQSLLQYQLDGKNNSALKTGLFALDEIVGGFSPGHLTILGGRPAMGKTAFAQNIAYMAYEQGHGTLFFSLEMTEAQLAARAISDIIYRDTGYVLPYKDLIKKDWTGDQYKMVKAAIATWRDMPLLIDATAGQSMSNLRRRIKKVKAKGINGKPLRLVVVDYLQLMTAGDRYRGNKVNEVSEISRQLKLAAKEFNISILCLSQLSRRVEERENKKPIMSDLRDSGSIEQDADEILFVYREAYYLEQQAKSAASLKFGKLAEDMEREAQFEAATADGKIEIIISKSRHGETGLAQLGFKKETGTIFNKKGAV